MPVPPGAGARTGAAAGMSAGAGAGGLALVAGPGVAEGALDWAQTGPARAKAAQAAKTRERMIFPEEFVRNRTDVRAGPRLSAATP